MWAILAPLLPKLLVGTLQLLGIINWVKNTLHDHSVQQMQQAADVAADQAATVQEVAHINEVKANVQNMSHDELVAQYNSLRATVAAANTGH